MVITWEEAILKTIAYLNGEAWLQQLYNNIEQFMRLSDYQKRETQWEGRPAYQHTIRSIVSDLCDKGVLKRTGRGKYAIIEKDYQTKTTVLSDLEAIAHEETRVEGKQRERFINYYERDPKLRSDAILFHGTKCKVCNFDFEDKYGDRGKNFIEVHHLKPVSELEGETIVDPKTDMTVVCSNCHRMIHRKKNDVLSVEELKRMISIASIEHNITQ